jgi:hypothetical protein
MSECIILGHTKGGKEVQLRKERIGNKTVRVIAFEGGGKVPRELEGIWPDPTQAVRAVTVYLERMNVTPKK